MRRFQCRLSSHPGDEMEEQTDGIGWRRESANEGGPDIVVVRREGSAGLPTLLDPNLDVALMSPLRRSSSFAICSVSNKFMMQRTSGMSLCLAVGSLKSGASGTCAIASNSLVQSSATSLPHLGLGLLLVHRLANGGIKPRNTNRQSSSSQKIAASKNDENGSQKTGTVGVGYCVQEWDSSTLLYGKPCGSYIRRHPSSSPDRPESKIAGFDSSSHVFTCSGSSPGLNHLVKGVLQVLSSLEFCSAALEFGNFTKISVLEVQREDFSGLRPPLRTRATAAASGSSEETLSLLDDLHDIPPKHLPCVLPVFYASLDSAPSRISATLTQFDLPGWGSIQPQIVQVHLCLRGLLYLAASKAIPRAAFLDLWHNLWPWIKFLDEHDECLPKNGLPDAVTRYAAFVSLIRSLHDEDSDAGTRRVIDATPGLFVVIGRAWRLFILAGHEEGIRDVSHFFKLGRWESASYTPDLIIGAGGRANLASTIVSHITRIIPGPDSHVTTQTLFHLTGTAYMVDNHEDAALKDALLSCGIVTALTTATRILCRSTVPLSKSLLGGIYSVMVKHISSYSPVLLVESLHAGLLETLFIQPLWLSLFSPCLAFLLKDLLPALTVYRSVLVQLQTSLPQVRDRDAAILGDETLLAHWKRFIALAESRLRILNKYNTGVLTRIKVCDDLKCAQIRPKEQLKRCGGCLTAFYCSETCQANDWRHGGHRQGCHELSLRLEDQSFLRALLYHEFESRRAEIADHHRRFTRQHPGKASCIRFDFTSGASIQLWPLEDEPLAPDFKFDVERATRSGGRLQLHLMKVVLDSESRFWPFLSYFKSADTL
ncbi:hypothetical protein C8R45DRAFT_1073614 [Mycena sanguinolenta]|nr:hypothetical protein C8R45DRAFT_1073614 [Mycena sanguinolenta]